jgi:tRNA threonylcarbamoyl adenosine modification protein YeaZ
MIEEAGAMGRAHPVLVLALDTATAATSVRVVAVEPGQEPTSRAERRHVDPRGHGEWLALLIDEALAEADARPRWLTAIVAGTGPGPFTGLRVGLATAAAMGQALRVPTYGVCSLDGIGAVPTGPPVSGDPAGAERVLVATDARRREIYWAVYQSGRRLTEPAVDRPADVLPALVEYGVRRAYGEGALRYRSVLGLPVAPEPLYPDPATLAAVAADRIVTGAPSERLAARYLRRPDAAEPHRPATPR